MAGAAVIDRQLEEWIRSGIERDERYTPEDIFAGLKTGELQIFRYPKGVVITQITGHNRLLVFLLSGHDFESWKAEVTNDLREFARSIGVSVIEAYCRPGLEKVLRDVGWIKEQVVLRLRKKEEGATSVRKPIRRI